MWGVRDGPTMPLRINKSNKKTAKPLIKCNKKKVIAQHNLSFLNRKHPEFIAINAGFPH